jgi:PrgI family protein
MSARIPLDVDLEDRLLYGLTPTHLAYMVVALLAGFAVWSSHLASSPIRAAACLLVIGAGAVVAWGRWRGRSADAWIFDAAMFTVRTQRIAWNDRLLSSLERGRGKRLPEPDLEAESAEARPVAAAA